MSRWGEVIRKKEKKGWGDGGGVGLRGGVGGFRLLRQW
jgi:hypothetical protein